MNFEPKAGVGKLKVTHAVGVFLGFHVAWPYVFPSLSRTYREMIGVVLIADRQDGGSQWTVVGGGEVLAQKAKRTDT